MVHARCVRAAFAIAAIASSLVMLAACKQKTSARPPLPAVRPSIVVDASGVAIDGAHVASRVDVPTASVGVVEPLRIALRDRRQAWKAANPGEDFPGFADVVLPPSLTCVEGTSVVTSIRDAGYFNQSVAVGGAPENVAVWLEYPHADDAKTPIDTFVTMRADGAIEVRGNPCMAPYDTVKLADLARALATRCAKEPCDGGLFVACEAGLRFADVFELYVTARRSQPNVSLGPESRCGAPLGMSEMPDAGALGFRYGATEPPWGYEPRVDAGLLALPSKGARIPKARRVRVESTRIEGPLGADAFERAAKTKTSDVVRCYDEALRRDPTVAGSITTYLTIGTAGGVADISYDGGDLADNVLNVCIMRVLRDVVVAPSPPAVSNVLYTLVVTQGA